MKNKLVRHLLFRYLLKELWVYFFIAFLFFFLIFFINHLLLNAEEILKKRVPLGTVLLFILYSLPFIIAQSAPFATLVGFLMCIGRMVSDNEILILRSTGHSYSLILIPVAVLGLVISLLSFAVNDYLLPLGTIAYNKLYLSIIISNPALELEPMSIKRTQDSTLVIGDVKEQTVSDLLLFDKDSSGQQRVVIASNANIVSPNKTGLIMQLNMDNASVVFLNTDEPDNFDFLYSEQAIMNIFSSAFLPSYSETNPREMTSWDLKIKLDEMSKSTGIEKNMLLNSYKLEFHKKFSLPFGSIFFALLAMPLAVLFGKHNGQTAGLIIGVIVAVFYWALMILGQQFGLRNGLDGFWTMWLPNILVGGFALVFFTKLIKK